MYMNKICQNCNTTFILDDLDMGLLIKLKVPEPTFCPECSHQRRFAWRNTHSLYHRPDSITGENLISIYHPETQMNVVNQKYWWSDAWDPMDYGRDFDFTRDFFSQWHEFRNEIPFQSLSNSKAVNSDYCNVAEESYDCYLISACWKNERTMYADSIVEDKDCMDLYVVNKSEYCYEDVYCSNSSRLFYSEKSQSCVNSYFLYDCKNCTDCFMSSNLRNKSYVFYNQQLSKEDYQEKTAALKLGSYTQIENLKRDFEKLKTQAIHKFAVITNSDNVTGNQLDRVSNSFNVFDVSENVKDCSNLYWCVKNVFETLYTNAVGMIENSYEMNDAGVGGSFCRFSSVVYSSNEIDYCFNCYNSNDLFGCIGLRSKSYCIFNKQYSKEEYFELLPKIKQHMMNMPYVDKKGRVYKYGEFFPIELSPFAYNETIAQSFYPLTKEKALALGYTWRDQEGKTYVPTQNKDTLPDTISEVTDSILADIIECAGKASNDRCPTAFKITENELAFYRRFNIPLPRFCYQCRHKARFSKRNPLKLWSRTCMCEKTGHIHGTEKCTTEFKTSYAPERTEIIYCEKCYQQEVI